MSPSFELGPVDWVTADAVGEPGSRTFYIQARAGDRVISVLAEKEQVRALSMALGRLVEALSGEEDVAAQEPPALEEPVLPEWRAGSISVEYDEGSSRIAITIEEMVAGEDEVPAEDPGSVRVEASLAQALGLAERAAEVVESGRPRCPICTFPIDPEGHACPAQNGHRRIGD